MYRGAPITAVRGSRLWVGDRSFHPGIDKLDPRSALRAQIRQWGRVHCNEERTACRYEKGPMIRTSNQSFGAWGPSVRRPVYYSDGAPDGIRTPDPPGSQFAE
jgi:hypothetical protein